MRQRSISGTKNTQKRSISILKSNSPFSRLRSKCRTKKRIKVTSYAGDSIYTRCCMILL